MRQAGRIPAGPALLALLLSAVLLWAPGAGAYPWMVKHHYTGCAACHVDPAGGGLQTAYGRVQAYTLLEGHPDAAAAPGAEQPEAERAARFLGGAVSPPGWLLLGLEFRGGALLTHAASGAARSSAVRPLQMATDLQAGVVAGSWRASASVGVALKRALPASLTRRGSEDGLKVVSREHWVGRSFADESVLVRAGRMSLPFGIRSVEHTLWARSATRTDSNEQQQHGLAVHWEEDAARVELMAILGNYQVHPDRYRERGAAALLEWVLGPSATLGWSSLATYAQEDLERGEPQTLRMAHGLSSRVGLGRTLAVLAEADVLLRRNAAAGHLLGAVGYAQVDWEPAPGLHLLGTLELLRADRPGGGGPQRGLWASVAWSVARALELRVDTYTRHAPAAGDAPARDSLVALLQLHYYP